MVSFTSICPILNSLLPTREEGEKVCVCVCKCTLCMLTFISNNSHLPTVGVLAALSDADEEIEEELSARAKGAVGGGLNGLGLKTNSYLSKC